MVRTELRKIIGRDVFCVAKSDDDTYWDISFPLKRLPLSDLHRILEALDATDSQRDLSLPPEEDHADSVSSLSMTVSQLLLRRNLGYDWECLHLAEDSFWILGVKDAPETNDFIKIGSQRFPLGELKSRQEVLDYLRENFTYGTDGHLRGIPGEISKRTVLALSDHGRTASRHFSAACKRRCLESAIQ